MVIKKVSFNGGESFFVAPSWDQIGKLCFDLSKKIDRSGQKFDRIIAIAKGGWTWTRTLADYLQIDRLDSMQIKLYRGIGKKFMKPDIFVSLNGSIEGQTVLLFDDVADTGETMQVARQTILDMGAKEVKTATLFFKPRSIVIPDFYEHETEAWIVFPHEIWEFIRETAKEWLEEGVSKTDMAERYRRLLLPEEQIRYFLNKL
jgi:hypoxanthine phosphoribosyltransferase